VFVHCVSHPGEHAFSRRHPRTIQPGSFGQPQPFFYASGATVVAVMVYDARAADAAEPSIVAARQDNRVFDRNVTLVAVPVQRPCLQLAARQLSLVHQEVKGMFVVVAFFTDLPQAGHQLGLGHGWRSGRSAQIWNSIPSSAISQPASLTWRCSALSSSRMGLVLFT